MGGSAWAAILGLIAVPYYLGYLGVQNYALIGLLGVLQSLSLLVDFGLPQSVGRAIASGTTANDRNRAATLVRTLEAGYLMAALGIGTSIWLVSGLIAKHWLNVDPADQAQVANAVALMGLVVSIRWPIALYQSVMIGFGRVGALSVVTASFATMATIGALLLIMLVSHTLLVFLAWQCVCAVAQLVVVRTMAWRILGKGEARVRMSSLAGIARFSGAMAGVTISAALLSQSDRIMLTSLLPLADFGYYVVAATVVGALYLVITPLFNIMYPHLTSLYAANQTDELEKSYVLGTKALVLVVFPLAVFVTVSCRALVHYWTGNDVTAQAVAPLVSIMMMGSAVHGAMYFPYALQLAMGRPGDALKTNLVLLAFMIPATYYLARRYGLEGGAISWLSFQLMYLFLGSFVVRRYLAATALRRWLLPVVMIPALIGLAAMWMSARDGVHSSDLRLLVRGMAAAFATFAGIALWFRIDFAELRQLFNSELRRG